jgi:L-rhamnose mutarotase
MERVCFSLEIYPGKEAEYKKRHDEIWPELVEAIEEAGAENFSLFRRELTVIAYLECHPDAATVFEKLGATEVNARWSEWFQDIVLSGENGGHAHYEEVWHLD